MKHTYLFPLKDKELWLWRAARMASGELFGDPHNDASDEEWALYTGIGEALGSAREELLRRLEDRNRICIGRHYVIPGSLCSRPGNMADETVSKVTHLLWDAPYFRGHDRADTMVILDKTAGEDDRDNWVDIAAFCKENFANVDNRIRVIPVWM